MTISGRRTGMASRPTAIVTATALCAALVAVSPTTAWADTENVASPGAILAAFGYAAVRCVLGR